MTAALRRRETWIAAGVGLVSLALAAQLLAAFLGVARLRWASILHDRNTHFAEAVDLAVDARAGDGLAVLRDLDRARQWPPLHAALAAAGLLAGGIDHRVAVAPSLLAWTATLVLAFAAARWAARGSLLAGSLAALLVAASPAHRAFATDVMLESLGAGLTLLALHAWGVARGGAGLAAWRVLGLALTLLLLGKYNYWLLAVASLALAEALRARAELPGMARRAAARARRSARPLAAAAARQPLAWIAAAGLVAALWVGLRGGGAIDLFGVEVSMRSAAGPLHVAWLALVLALVPWWRRSGRERFRGLDARLQTLARWHALPLGVYFLLPARLGKLIAYVSPGNSPVAWAGPIESARAQLRWLAGDYHAGTAAGAAVAALAALGISRLGARPEARLAFGAALAVCALSTWLHPHQQSRFLHSWIAALWVLAGAGLAALAGAPQSGLRRAAGVIVLLLAGVWPLALAPPAGRSQQPGHRALVVTTLDLTDAALDLADGARRVAFLSTLPMEEVVRWSFFERRSDRAGFEGFVTLGGDPAQASARFERWLSGSQADAVVLIDVARGSPLFFGAPDGYAEAARLVREEPTLRRVATRELRHLDASVSLWAREGR